jgi:hypothetical protein
MTWVTAGLCSTALRQCFLQARGAQHWPIFSFLSWNATMTNLGVTQSFWVELLDTNYQLRMQTLAHPAPWRKSHTLIQTSNPSTSVLQKTGWFPRPTPFRAPSQAFKFQDHLFALDWVLGNWSSMSTKILMPTIQSSQAQLFLRGALLDAMLKQQ